MAHNPGEVSESENGMRAATHYGVHCVTAAGGRDHALRKLRQRGVVAGFLCSQVFDNARPEFAAEPGLLPKKRGTTTKKQRDGGTIRVAAPQERGITGAWVGVMATILPGSRGVKGWVLGGWTGKGATPPDATREPPGLKIGFSRSGGNSDYLGI